MKRKPEVSLLPFLLPFLACFSVCLYGFWWKVDPLARRWLGRLIGASVVRDKFDIWRPSQPRSAPSTESQQLSEMESRWAIAWRSILCRAAQQALLLSAFLVSATLALVIVVVTFEGLE